MTTPRSTRNALGLLVVGALALSACGGGGGRRIFAGGKICKAGYWPVSMDAPAGGSKLALDPDVQALPAGKYTFQSVDLFYFNKKTNTKFQVRQAVNEKAAGGNTDSNVCASGMTGAKEFTATTMVISGMVVPTSGKIEIAVKEVNFGFGKEGIIKRFPDGNGSGFDKPSKVYEGQSSPAALFKLSDKDNSSFEIRSEHVAGDETVFTKVVLKRTDLSP